MGGALGRRPGWLSIMPGGRGPEAPPTLGLPDIMPGGRVGPRSVAPISRVIQLAGPGKGQFPNQFGDVIFQGG